MKFVKRLSTLLLALSLGAVVALPAYAHEVPDPSRTGSIRFSMLYDGSTVGGGSLTLHRVGDVAEEDGNYTFTLTEAYAASGADLTDTALAAGLADYTTANGIAGEEVTIGSDGTAADGLALGLYLVMQDQPAEGYEPIAPFLVSVPMWDETAGAYLYTVDAAPKLGGLTKTPPAATAAPAKPSAGGDGFGICTVCPPPRGAFVFPAVQKNCPAGAPRARFCGTLLVEVRSMSKLILVIEDEPAIQNILRAFLLDAGYRVALAGDGPAGVDRFRADPPDLVLLDLMLPGMDGFAVCQLLRRESRVPIIMLTALDDDDSQLKGFDALADDYITKPFSMPLVLKRIEAVLRRAGPADPAPDQADGLLRCGPVTLDPASQTVRVDGQCVSLTLREYDILKLLLENQGRVVSRETLLDCVWGYSHVGDDKVINTHIKNIRKKLGVDCIETIRGAGYKIEKEV